ncbi:MAG: ATP-binding cassette domain-containing protein [Bacillota bacterium]|nr:ATP-binding cassette domain-containing protein [Bacillota bacterium]
MVVVKNLRKIFTRNKTQLAKLQKENKSKGITEKPERDVVAVDRLSFTANNGEIFGLLGANGAGKTTSLRCVSTLYKPLEGEIYIDGVDIVKKPEYARANIAFLTSELKLDKYFTLDYTMTYYGRLKGMSDADIAKRKEELCEIFEMKDFLYKKISELSTGMLQKASLATSLINDPQTIIFDEPTNGLDIVTARRVTDFLIDQKKKGKTVIISTHIMSLVEKLCDRVAIIMEGSLAIEGTIAEVLEKTGCKDLEDAFFKFFDEREAEKKAKKEQEAQ